MSETSKKGRDFEMKVAKLIRMKIDKHARRNSGSHANWHRRSDIFTDLPIHVEAKDHENIRIKDWIAQAQEAAFGKTPVVAWNLDGEVIATLAFDDLLNLFVEIADYKAEIEDLKRPINPNYADRVGDEILMHSKDEPVTHPTAVPVHKPVFTDGNLKREVVLCKGGHICSPGRDTCMTKGCKYSNTYKAPKAKDQK